MDPTLEAISKTDLKGIFGFDPYNDSLEDIEDAIEAMDEKQLIAKIKRTQPEWERPEWMTLDNLKANLVDQTVALRRQKESSSQKKETPEEKMTRLGITIERVPYFEALYFSWITATTTCSARLHGIAV